MKISSPIRVLQIFGVLSNIGGAEKWILDLLRMRDSRVRFDFLLSLDEGFLVSEIRRLGSTVYLVPFSKSPLPWAWSNPYLSGVRKILRNNKYDVIHVHQFDLSGEILRIAALENVPVRVMSVHATQYDNPRFYRRFVHRVYGRPQIFRYATDILPCSQTVAESFTPSAPKFQTAKTQILYTGIDPAVFEEANRRRNKISQQIRKELGLPDHATILGHIGRFTHQKNHRFLLELLEFLQDTNDTNNTKMTESTNTNTNTNISTKTNSKIRKSDSWYAVLVGQGENWEVIRRDIQNKKIRDRVILTGLRLDVPDLFCSLFDVFLLPSFYEGLPIVAMEALASGLGVVYSDRISHELDDFFPQRIRRVSLEAPKTHWIEAIHEMIAARCETSLALTELATTPFTLQSSLEHLISIYTSHRNSLFYF
ncbi:MAG: glycosyltransferase [Planctomycetaceae bacterium]|jgi:glycosyltransferase involved in cell wall biosynthesis|nr:glycosyltransferase [Planctomycetaceae bacterium]